MGLKKKILKITGEYAAKKVLSTDTANKVLDKFDNAFCKLEQKVIEAAVKEGEQTKEIYKDRNESAYFLIFKKKSFSAKSMFKVILSHDISIGSDMEYNYIICDKNEKQLYCYKKEYTNQGIVIHIYNNKEEIATIKEKFFTIGDPFEFQREKREYIITHKKKKICTCGEYKYFGNKTFYFHGINMDVCKKGENDFVIKSTISETVEKKKFFDTPKYKTFAESETVISRFVDGYEDDFMLKYYVPQRREMLVIITIAYIALFK